MKIISIIILAVGLIVFLLDVLNGLYEKDKEEMNDLFKETEDKIFETKRKLEEIHYLHFNFKQDVETQQKCYELVQQKQELDRLILERQIENGNNEIKERYKRCPNCGANLNYKNGVAICKYCDSEWS